ncbi:uncharacterized GMC-type oxidoreductase Mb1310-like [Amphiura filiformis]|uniref:uncharacterized GMC-type oxidoreductase Mb1310-like n=1 Tax=Amphiura filiformis TaxID=82378 RepID=UPI003B20CE2F
MSSSSALYDFIVVGGGTSGCVVASRLSEDTTINVLLLEAGPNDEEGGDLIRVPRNLAATMKTKYDWDYKTVPQLYACKAYRDNVCVWPRGKILGGSTSINGLAYVRGHREDFESWKRLGCDGWGWNDVLPFFQKFENFISTGSAEEQKYGKMDISDNLFGRSEASKKFIRAGAELGYENVDINNNSGSNIGVGTFPSIVTSEGVRCSTAVAYIHPSRRRHNLTIVTNAHVTKVDIRHKRAVGVFAHVGKELKYFSARKEVVLCGGAINSPQVLMLSGIGPKEHLEELGIVCIQDLPVGKNLQDHMDIHVKADVKPGSDVFTINKSLSSSNQSEVAAFIRTKLETQMWPDLEIQPLSLFYAFGLLAPLLYPLRSPRFYPYFGFDIPIAEYRQREGYTYQLILLHPKSRGEIRLQSTDPLMHPIIDPHYLENQHDVDVLVEAIRIAKTISESKAMLPLELKHVDLKMPSSFHSTWSSENLEEYVRHFAWTLYHPVGTCKMGASNDSTAVVDPQLRVKGITGLRVVDASIMPHLTSGNTMSPSIMIGEKGADLIRETRTGTHHTDASKL